MSFRLSDTYQNHKLRDKLYSKGGSITGNLTINGKEVNPSAVSSLKKYYAVLDLSVNPLKKYTGSLNDISASVPGLIYPYSTNTAVPISKLIPLEYLQDLWWDSSNNQPISDSSGSYILPLTLYDDKGNQVDYIPKNRAITQVNSQQLERLVAEGEGSILSRDLSVNDTSFLGRSTNGLNILSYGCVNVPGDCLALLGGKNINYTHYGSAWTMYNSYSTMPLYAFGDINNSRFGDRNLSYWVGDYEDYNYDNSFNKTRVYRGEAINTITASSSRVSNTLGGLIENQYLDTKKDLSKIINERAVKGQSILPNGKTTHFTSVEDRKGNLLGYKPFVCILGNTDSTSTFMPSNVYNTSTGEPNPTLRGYSLNQGKIGFSIITENVSGDFI